MFGKYSITKNRGFSGLIGMAMQRRMSP